jgi:hypothetical protein
MTAPSTLGCRRAVAALPAGAYGTLHTAIARLASRAIPTTRAPTPAAGGGASHLDVRRSRAGRRFSAGGLAR